MRTLFVGALAATLVGCSCNVSPLATMEACAGGNGLACLDRSSVNQGIEPEPAPTPKAKPKIAAKTEKPPSAHARHKDDLGRNTAKSATPTANVETATAKLEAAPIKVESAPTKVEAAAPKAETAAARVEPPAPKVEPPASGRPAETSDPVIAKAKATIASRLDDPKSAEFGEMKRAMRTNTRGRLVDTICGYVKVKQASGEGTGEKPFLYLVKDDEAYVVDGPPTSIAATAFRNICN
jgi:hypothetical protein